MASITVPFVALTLGLCFLAAGRRRQWWSRLPSRRRLVSGLASPVAETAILMAPPYTFIRCFNRDKQGVSSK